MLLALCLTSFGFACGSETEVDPKDRCDLDGFETYVEVVITSPDGEVSRVDVGQEQISFG